MSPLVPGFYTDDFAREVDRRVRLMGGQGLAKVEGESLRALRASWWGKPRYDWRHLGWLRARRGSLFAPAMLHGLIG